MTANSVFIGNLPLWCNLLHLETVFITALLLTSMHQYYRTGNSQKDINVMPFGGNLTKAHSMRNDEKQRTRKKQRLNCATGI